MEQLEASLSVPIFRWGETAREIEHAIVRFGLERRGVRSRWRGLRVCLTARAGGDTARVDALAAFFDVLASQTGSELDVHRITV